MRFESFMWAVLALLLAGSAAWDDATTLQPPETELRFEKKDGTSTIPPGP